MAHLGESESRLPEPPLPPPPPTPRPPAAAATPPLPPPPPPPGRAGLRQRKGDIRIALLGLLHEEPNNGYQLMQSIATRSGGRWRPSAGSVYPTLSQLTDENLVTVPTGDPLRRHHLTAAGRDAAAAQQALFDSLWPHDPRPSSTSSGTERIRELCHQMQQLADRLGDTEPPERLTRAAAILENAHHDLRRLFPGREPG